MEKVYCFVIDHEKSALMDPFPVEIEPEACVRYLQRRIKEVGKDEAGIPEHVVLNVLRCEELSRKTSIYKLKEQLLAIEFTDMSRVKKIYPSRKVGKLGLADDELLLVQLPASAFETWCLLIDHEKSAIGTFFSVCIDRSANVRDLKEAVKEKKPLHLSDIDPESLTVWRCLRDPLVSTMSKSDMKKRLSSIDLVDASNVCELGPGTEVGSLGLEVLLVQLPAIERATGTEIIAALEDSRHDVVARDLRQTRRTRSLIVNVDGPVRDAKWLAIVMSNDFDNLCQDLKSFIEKIVNMKRRLSEDLTVFDVCKIREALNEVLSDEPDAVAFERWYLEILHYVQAFALQRSWLPKDELTECRVHDIVLGGFERYWMLHVTGGTCTFHKRLPFPLLIKEIVNGQTQEFRKYSPQPDAVFLKNGFPYFFAEIDSHDNEEDKQRMHVQASCALRFATELLKNDSRDPRDKDLFLMAAFFKKEWSIERFFYYYDDQGKLCVHKKEYYIRDFDSLARFFTDFYNYARHVQEDNKLAGKVENIKVVAKNIERNVKKSFFTSKGTKRTRPNEDGGSGRGKRIASEMGSALQKSGFVVGAQNKSGDVFDALKLPDNIVEATSPDGDLVIAKLSRKNSKEVSLLREISRIKSSHNHVIPFWGTIESSLGLLIILPRGESVCDALDEGRLTSQPIQLCRELVEGVAFLHRLKIAHLDIKPANLVYKDGHLLIIDFDISMRCEDVECMVEISCGTEGWAAPEIAQNDYEPLRAFSPIRADLWSCGKVLDEIMLKTHSTDNCIKLLVMSLMDCNPRRRPLLSEVVEEEPDFWTTGRLLWTLENRVRCDEGREMTVADGVGAKRVRSHTDAERSGAKVVKKARSPTAWDPSWSPSPSSPSHSPPFPSTPGSQDDVLRSSQNLIGQLRTTETIMNPTAQHAFVISGIVKHLDVMYIANSGVKYAKSVTAIKAHQTTMTRTHATRDRFICHGYPESFSSQEGLRKHIKKEYAQQND